MEKKYIIVLVSLVIIAITLPLIIVNYMRTFPTSSIEAKGLPSKPLDVDAIVYKNVSSDYMLMSIVLSIKIRNNLNKSIELIRLYLKDLGKTLNLDYNLSSDQEFIKNYTLYSGLYRLRYMCGWRYPITVYYRVYGEDVVKQYSVYAKAVPEVYILVREVYLSSISSAYSQSIVYDMTIKNIYDKPVEIRSICILVENNTYCRSLETTIEAGDEMNFSDIIDLGEYVCMGCNVLVIIIYKPVSHEETYQLIFPYTVV